MGTRGRWGAFLVVILLVGAGCSSAATSAPTAPPGGGQTQAAAATAAPIPGGLLDKVLKAGKMVVSTDAKYPPQSEQRPDGTFQGFDIDVATEIAKRLGVKVEFITPDWSIITAGSWGGRWDASVGSMTITPEREKVLDFSPPYYYTPAQLSASKASGITTVDGLAGKTICAGDSTTYAQWLSGTLDFGPSVPKPPAPPAGAKLVTLSTDTDCPDQWRAGRNDFQGWASALATIDNSIKAGMPVVKVGNPVYYEPLAVAVDRSGPKDTDFVAAVSKIVTDMHADGTLTAFSMKWYGTDLTKATP